jgi:hypothetical protein
MLPHLARPETSLAEMRSDADTRWRLPRLISVNQYDRCDVHCPTLSEFF